jgi:hypothetical protein
MQVDSGVTAPASGPSFQIQVDNYYARAFGAPVELQLDRQAQQCYSPSWEMTVDNLSNIVVGEATSGPTQVNGESVSGGIVSGEF